MLFCTNFRIKQNDNLIENATAKNLIFTAGATNICSCDGVKCIPFFILFILVKKVETHSLNIAIVTLCLCL